MGGAQIVHVAPIIQLKCLFNPLLVLNIIMALKSSAAGTADWTWPRSPVRIKRRCQLGLQAQYPSLHRENKLATKFAICQEKEK